MTHPRFPVAWRRTIGLIIGLLAAISAWRLTSIATSHSPRARHETTSTPGYVTIRVRGILNEEALLMTGEPAWIQQRWIIDGRPPLYWSAQSGVYYFSPSVLQTAFPDVNGVTVDVSAPAWWDPLSAPITGRPLTLQVPSDLPTKIPALLNGP